MRSERTIVGLVGAVQFVNIVDFMMVMPLGPDFSAALGVPVDKVGVVGGAYTAAAAVAGVALSPLLDRMDRRKALALCMAGLALSTALGGLAWGLGSLVAARVLAGLFGGPASSVALAVVADVVPQARRGRALGAVMGAFSVASVVGVPIGLWLAGWAGWRTPFFVLAGAGLAISASAVTLLPPLTGHFADLRARPALRELLALPAATTAYLSTAALTFSGFCVIPNLSAFIQGNMGWPRAWLPYLYMAGGTLSFGALRAFGAFADRWGAPRVMTGGTLAFVVLLVAWLGVVPALLPVWVLFPAMMVAMSARNVSHQTLVSQVPRPAQRAAFQSLNSAVQHSAAALAAFFGTLMLGSTESGALVGMPALAAVAVLVALPVPLLLRLTAKAVAQPAG